MSSDTPETILQVARRLFIQQGYTATSMRQIAEEAGIGKATIYHHFADKKTLALALMQDTTYDMSTAIEQVRAETEPRRRIETAIKMAVEYLFGSVDIMAVLRRELPEARQVMTDNFVIFFSEYLKLLSETFQQGMDQGLFRPVNPQETARVFLSMVQGTFAMVYITGERAMSPEKTAAAMLDVFFHGIEVHPTS